MSWLKRYLTVSRVYALHVNWIAAALWLLRERGGVVGIELKLTLFNRTLKFELRRPVVSRVGVPQRAGIEATVNAYICCLNFPRHEYGFRPPWRPHWIGSEALSERSPGGLGDDLDSGVYRESRDGQTRFEADAIISRSGQFAEKAWQCGEPLPHGYLSLQDEQRYHVRVVKVRDTFGWHWLRFPLYRRMTVLLLVRGWPAPVWQRPALPGESPLSCLKRCGRCENSLVLHLRLRAWERDFGPPARS